MKKIAAAALALSLIATGAVAIATAGATAGIGAEGHANFAHRDTKGIVSCETQVWPNIDTLCLTSVSDGSYNLATRRIGF